VEKSKFFLGEGGCERKVEKKRDSLRLAHSGSMSTREGSGRGERQNEEKKEGFRKIFSGLSVAASLEKSG